MVVIGEISAMKKRTAGNSKARRAETALRAFALRFPGAAAAVRVADPLRAREERLGVGPLRAVR